MREATAPSGPGSFARGTGLTARAVYRFARRWPVVPMMVLGSLGVAAILARWIAPQGPFTANLDLRFGPPIWYQEGSSAHILGLDHQGRDVFARLIYGSRVSLTVAGCVIGISGLFGVTLGLASGYLGGLADELLMRLVELQMSIPLILVVMVIVVIMGQSLPLLVILIAVWSWAGYARQVRAETLSLKYRDYVSLARVAGASHLRIVLKHIVPGIANTAVVIATLQVGSIILTEAILSFLGAGVPPPTPSWGSMVADGRSYLASAWWIAFFPGMAIFLTVASFNFLGDWIRDKLDPRLRQL